MCKVENIHKVRDLEYEISILRRLNIDFQNETEYQSKIIHNLEVDLASTTNKN